MLWRMHLGTALCRGAGRWVKAGQRSSWGSGRQSSACSCAIHSRAQNALHEGEGQVLLGPQRQAALHARQAQRGGAQALDVCCRQALHQLADLVDRAGQGGG